MKPFLDEHFLLQNKTAEKLYHEYAKQMPVIDYHCHLPPQQIAENHSFQNITQAWLYGDHYKWRAMRTNGVHESYCTGDQPDQDKFEKWAATVPYTLRNPLYHWTHLELQRYFGITEILNADSAKLVYETASNLIKTPEYSVQNLLRKMNVALVCTTSSPLATPRCYFEETVEAKTSLQQAHYLASDHKSTRKEICTNFPYAADRPFIRVGDQISLSSREAKDGASYSALRKWKGNIYQMVSKTEIHLNQAVRFTLVTVRSGVNQWTVVDKF